MSSITDIDNDTWGTEGTITFTYRGVKFRTTIAHDDNYYESPLEANMGDVLVVYALDSLPEEHEESELEWFLEYHELPETFMMLYESGLITPIHWYAETTRYALLDYMATFHKMQDEWGYTGTLEEARATIEENLKIQTIYNNGEWYYVSATTELLDSNGEPVPDYSDSCWGLESYIFDSHSEQYQYGLDALEDQAREVYRRYITKYHGQIPLPLEETI